MKKVVSKIVLSCVLVVGLIVAVSATDNPNKNRDKLIGNIIKNALESYHYLGVTIDDGISQKAFSEFIKKMDYGKQFFLKSDVKDLEKMQMTLDDAMVNGDSELVDKAVGIINKRVELIDKFRQETFKKGFDFNKQEEIELDPEKRDFVNTEDELKDLWRKLFKQAALTRYIDLVEEQEELRKESKEKSKDKKKNKKNKKVKGEITLEMTEKDIFEKAHKTINEKYERVFARIKKEDHEDNMEKFFNSIAQVFDPHTSYLPPKRKEDFDIDISGSLEGIGAVLQEDGQYIKVVSIVPGGAAWRQKELEVEDMILAVGQGDKEPISLIDMRVDDAVRYIRGKKDTEVRLTVKKVDGSRKVVKIVRDVVEIAASFAKSSVVTHKDLGMKIGYIYVPKFYRDFNDNGEDARNCSDDVKAELENLKKQKVDGIILDLRNNGGGALEDARQMTGLFIKDGPVVQIRNHRGQVEVLRDTDPSITYDGPVVVLINRFSASASEIVAAALQDYKRAVVVGGEFSHGKGTVQAVLNLNQGPLLSVFGPTMGALKVTIQKFYRINGSSTQYKGVVPDIILPDPMGYAKNREQDLDYSLKWDKVKELEYKEWGLGKIDVPLLLKRSEKRVSTDKRFAKIKESVDYLVKRRDETKVSLHLDTVKKQEKENLERTKSLKIEDINKDILVTNFEESLKSNQKIRPGDEEKWKKDLDQRKEEWVKGLQQDPTLEEGLYILSDMKAMSSGQSLSMSK